MKILITGGAGFVGSHIAEFYAKKGDEVIVFDNLSRMKLLKKKEDERQLLHNWNYLKKYENIQLVKGDVTDFNRVKGVMGGVEVIFHTAAQTAVTTSVVDPMMDFKTNNIGTFNVLEAARRKIKNPTVIFCSTNKVYGENVNNIRVEEQDKRYVFEEKYSAGINETFSVDSCMHSPYGCSKLCADIYMQEYAHLYGFRVGVFRMSCIYGTRQFGMEDQGWIAWFTIATIMDKPITIYGDGKQVRDLLWVDDLVKAYDAFIRSDKQIGVFNTGGGVSNTLSILELFDIFREVTGKDPKIDFTDWRPADQKVYVSDIRKIEKELNWKPLINPEDGTKKLIEWVMKNKEIFV